MHLEAIFWRMRTQESMTRKLREDDQMAWVGPMNSIQTCFKEIILSELVYGEG